MKVPLAVAILVAAAACAHGAGQSTPAAAPSGSRAIPSGCDKTRVTVGSQPAWTLSAGSLAGLPVAVSEEGNAAGFLFGSLRAGHQTDPNNKILWVVAEPRNGQPLHVAAVRDGSAGPVVTDSFPANSSPGEIYPSIVDVPVEGCWRFTLQWGPHRANLSLRYTSAGDRP